MTSKTANWITFGACALLLVILIWTMPAHSQNEPVEACTPISSQINDDLLAKVAKNNDRLVVLEDANAYAFQRSVEEALGVQAPFSADFVAVLMRSDPQYAGVGTVLFGQDGCVVSVKRFPSALIARAIGIVTAKPVEGEKVD